MVHFSWRHVNQQNIGNMPYKLYTFDTHFSVHIHQYKFKLFLSKISQVVKVQVLTDDLNVFSKLQKFISNAVFNCLVVVVTLGRFEV